MTPLADVGDPENQRLGYLCALDTAIERIREGASGSRSRGGDTRSVERLTGRSFESEDELLTWWDTHRDELRIVRGLLTEVDPQTGRPVPFDGYWWFEPDADTGATTLVLDDPVEQLTPEQIESVVSTCVSDSLACLVDAPTIERLAIEIRVHSTGGVSRVGIHRTMDVVDTAACLSTCLLTLEFPGVNGGQTLALELLDDGSAVALDP